MQATVEEIPVVRHRSTFGVVEITRVADPVQPLPVLWASNESWALVPLGDISKV